MVYHLTQPPQTHVYTYIHVHTCTHTRTLPHRNQSVVALPRANERRAWKRQSAARVPWYVHLLTFWDRCLQLNTSSPRPASHIDIATAYQQPYDHTNIYTYLVCTTINAQTLPIHSTKINLMLAPHTITTPLPRWLTNTRPKTPLKATAMRKGKCSALKPSTRASTPLTTTKRTFET